MLRDPVCGMWVDKDRAMASRDYKGQTFYFCSDTCRGEFDKNPEKYASHPGVTTAPG